jgi:superfamily II DNA or RNA helicase
MSGYAVGSLVAARGREWVVLPDSSEDFLVLRPLGGGDDDIAGVLPVVEPVRPASFPPPTVDDLGDQASASLLRSALRIGFRSSAGPFRSLASLAVDPRPYQLVPLMLALRQETVRLLIADDVGIGKTIEAALIAAELLTQGDATGLAVLCSPALAEQWQGELRTKFGIDAQLVLPSTVTKLERNLPLGTSLFDRHRHVIVSTDFIKSPRRRDDFVRACPDLVIVDEAHTCVASSTAGSTARTQRYELLQRLAANADRHLLLVTATPHSGKDEAFRNLLGLLEPVLAYVKLDHVKGREHLARHMVQRRRRDIRSYLDEHTPFPRDRHTKEVDYSLTPGYDALFGKVVNYAREQVRDASDGAVRQRVRWWSVLALLRSLASSPRAAAETLTTRAAGDDTRTTDEADELGRAAVFDHLDADTPEGIDATPGADTDRDPTPESTHRRRLRALAREARALEGGQDAKLAEAIAIVKGLLADGYDPIVFCRFIPTAEYVAEHLTRALGDNATVAAVTGTLPPAERKERIHELTDIDGRHVLVATDCLSEGVNLQDAFQAVVHYDLAWNPTRHEQREGRVDRFGQRADVVRAVTLYGRDNRIDGIVLDVLLRKHKAIRDATGVSVPVPDESDSVVEAVLEGVLLREKQLPEQLTLDGIGQAKRDALWAQWESAADREKQSITKYAQLGIKPTEVQAELDRVRAALGTAGEVREFTREALAALTAIVVTTEDGFTASVSSLPIGLRDAFRAAAGGRERDPMPFHTDYPVPRGAALLTRTDPVVEALAQHVLDTALDPNLPGAQRPARRCGVIRTDSVLARTTLLLVRFRFHLTLPSRTGERPLVAEDAHLLAYHGSATNPDWLDDEQARQLVHTTATANVPIDQARTFIGSALDALPALTPALDKRGHQLAEQLRDSHRGVREAAGVVRRGLKVTAQRPADVLGVYVYLPVPGGSA